MSEMIGNVSIYGKKLFGTTFSHREFKYRGLDWRKCLYYMRSLPVEFNFLRVGAYWNEIQPQKEDEYSWEDLDQVIDAIETEDRYDILLSVGMKAPRYPEYYIPKWALPTPPDENAEISKNQQLRERTIEFIKAVVNRYKDRDVIKAWQVENEPMDRAGEKKWFIGADFVAEEALAIRKLDQRPIVINCWCQDQRISSKPWGESDSDSDYAVKNAITIADVLGLDTYVEVNGEVTTKTDRCITRPQNYIHRAISAGKLAWIIESQAEKWQESDPNKIIANSRWLMDQHIKQGFPGILLWGLEWWWELKQKRNDEALFNHVTREARRFGMLSRVFHNWTTPKATNLASYKGKLYLTVVGKNNEIWLLSSNDDGKNWTPSQVLVNGQEWQTQHPIGIAVSPDGTLYLTVVGKDNNKIWLISRNKDNSWTPSQVLVDGQEWQTQYPVGIAFSPDGTLYLTVVGNKDKEIWLLFPKNKNDKEWECKRVLEKDNWQTQHPVGIAFSPDGTLYLTVVGNLDKGIWLLYSKDKKNNYKEWKHFRVWENWQTEHPIGIAISQGTLYLTVVGNDKGIWLLSSTDKENEYKKWEAPQSGIFKDWQTDQAISITEFKEGSNSSESRIHLSLVGLTEGEIYICTDNPVV
ncbi:MAG TPA: hypothetical protein DD379_25165 [Cyanobacteria bacterium UBA11162]|nr:hypothetical protein [Cyanobacteria bacterium UBA11162]